EMHRLPANDPRRDELRRYVRVRLMHNVREWWRELPSPRGIAWDWFVRGFAESLQGLAPVFIERAPRLFEAAPLRFVRLVTAGGSELTDLAQLPDASRLQRLELTLGRNPFVPERGLHQAEATALADSPYLKGLTCFRLFSGALSPNVQAILQRRFGS